MDHSLDATLKSWKNKMNFGSFEIIFGTYYESIEYTNDADNTAHNVGIHTGHCKDKSQ